MVASRTAFLFLMKDVRVQWRDFSVPNRCNVGLLDFGLTPKPQSFYCRQNLERGASNFSKRDSRTGVGTVCKVMAEHGVEGLN